MRSYYEIIKDLGNDLFQLVVLLRWRGSNVFYTDRLRKYLNNPLPKQEAENPELEVLEDKEEEYKVEEILVSWTYYSRL